MLKYIAEIRTLVEFIEGSATTLNDGLAKDMIMKDVASIRTYLRWEECAETE